MSHSAGTWRASTWIGPWLWLGLLMGLGYVAILFVHAYTWILLGGLVAVGLIVAALVARRDRGSEA